MPSHVKAIETLRSSFLGKHFDINHDTMVGSLPKRKQIAHEHTRTWLG